MGDVRYRNWRKRDYSDCADQFLYGKIQDVISLTPLHRTSGRVSTRPLVFLRSDPSVGVARDKRRCYPVASVADKFYLPLQPSGLTNSLVEF